MDKNNLCYLANAQSLLLLFVIFVILFVRLPFFCLSRCLFVYCFGPMNSLSLFARQQGYILCKILWYEGEAPPQTYSSGGKMNLKRGGGGKHNIYPCQTDLVSMNHA